MSAAVKLKALLHEAETAERGWDNDIHGEPLLVAFPQIVALVEAAEQLPEFFKTDDGHTHSFVPLLDALDEVLGDDE